MSWEQAAFAAIRVRQMGFLNVWAVCAGDDMRLPLSAQFFDAVVMNGVLEWLGCAEHCPGSPEDGQLAMLREVHRALKPGGQLYIASK
ncbi:MAG: class I SAM-dependent methyltransferase, partial [Myxococcales bacterium]|nr:class I SAM-dependent methyltransferase [Myxococcales bacterium]